MNSPRNARTLSSPASPSVASTGVAAPIEPGEVSTFCAAASERAVTGAICESGQAALEQAVAAGLQATDLADGTLRAAYVAAVARIEAGEPCDVETIHRGLNGKLDTRTAERLIERACLVHQVGKHSAQIVQAARRRRVNDVVARAQRRLADPSENPAMVAADLQTELAAVPAAGGFPRIVKGGDFTAIPLPRPPEIIEGVLYRGGKMVFGGPSKSFKTWNLIDLAFAVATGGEWLGFPTAQGNALYINLELAEFSTQRRLLEIAQARGCSVPDALRVWNLRGYSSPLDKLLPELLRQIKGEGYSLILVDPIYKTLAGREENDTGAIGEVCNEIEQVAVKTGAAVAFGSHFAKGNASSKNAIDRISGSGVFARDPDAILTATPHDSEGAFTLDLTLRDFAPVESFVIRWEFPRMHRDETLDPADLKKVKAGRSAQYAVEDILKHIGTEPVSSGDWKRVCQDEVGISNGTWYALKQQAERAGRIEVVGKKWRIKTGWQP